MDRGVNVNVVHDFRLKSPILVILSLDEFKFDIFKTSE